MKNPKENMLGRKKPTMIKNNRINYATEIIKQFALDISKVEIKDGKFEVKGSFTLGKQSDGIDPLTEYLSLKMGTFMTTIQPGFFELNNRGTFKLEKEINGVELEIMITPDGDNGFDFKVEGKGVDLTGISNPVEIKLTIGDDYVITTILADIE